VISKVFNVRVLKTVLKLAQFKAKRLAVMKANCVYDSNNSDYNPRRLVGVVLKKGELDVNMRVDELIEHLMHSGNSSNDS